jgi:peptidyl-prolyl cis-trans isomerase D
MLELLRRKARSPYLQATIVIIILVFIFWGVGSNNGNVQNSVATVNDDSISFQDYQKEYDRTINTLRDQFGGAIPTSLLDSLNIKQQVLNKLVQGALLRQGGLAAGLYVSDQELGKAIQDMEAFKQNGYFDKQWYKEVLTSSRLSITKFEEGLRNDLLSAKVLDHLSRFVHPSEESIRSHFNSTYQTTQFNYVELPADSFTDKVELTEEKLNSFYEENKLNYQSDPKTKLHYLLFPFDAAKLPTPADAEVEQRYQNTLNRYAVPEKRSARHILFRTGESAEKNAEQKNRAEELLAQISNGADFAEKAKEFSEDGSAAKGGDLGFFQHEQMVKPFADAAYSLAEGEVSGIVETQFGYHIIKLDKIDPAHLKPLAEVREQIIAQLQQEAEKVGPFEQANSAYEGIILSGSLAKYIEKAQEQGQNLPLTITDLFTQLDPPKALLTLPEIVNAGFSLKQGELSSILETSKGYAIVYVAETQPPAPLELAAVKEQVEKDFIDQSSQSLAQKTAESLLESLKNGADFAEEAKKLGLELQETPFISKNDFSAATLPGQIIQESFTLSAATIYPKEIASLNNTYYVVGFKDRQDPDETLFEEKREEITDQLVKERHNDLLNAWLENLRRSADITTNEKLL